MILSLQDVSVFSNDRIILNTFSLSVKKGDILLIVGPSGAGKSTLLNYIAGFIPSKNNQSKYKWFAGINTSLKAEGDLLYENTDITNYLPETREFSMIGQKYNVYPHMNVLENIGYPLKLKKIEESIIDVKVKKLANTVKLPKTLWSNKVSTLSGGEQQRVAIAKALAKNGNIGLLDESFSHLDPLLREDLTELFFTTILQKESNLDTILMVSHDWSDIQYATKVILVVDGHDTLENVIEFIPNLNKKEFITNSELDTETKIRWSEEINKAYSRVS